MVVYQTVCVCLFLSDSRKHQDSKKEEEKKKPHIKKPLNAFMLYMKEMRAKVVAECTLKESAAINQILGRRVGRLFMGGMAQEVKCPVPFPLKSPFPSATFSNPGRHPHRDDIQYSPSPPP